MITGCTLVAVAGTIGMLVDPTSVGMNAGGVLCAPRWNDYSTPTRRFLINTSMFLWTAVTVISFLSFALCLRHVRSVKLSMTHRRAESWDHSSTASHLKYWFAVLTVMAASWSILALTVWWAVATRRPVAAAFDQAALLLVALYYMLYPVSTLCISTPLRQAVINLLKCKTPATVAPLTISTACRCITDHDAGAFNSTSLRLSVCERHAERRYSNRSTPATILRKFLSSPTQPGAWFRVEPLVHTRRVSKSAETSIQAFVMDTGLCSSMQSAVSSTSASKFPHLDCKLVAVLPENLGPVFEDV